MQVNRSSQRPSVDDVPLFATSTLLFVTTALPRKVSCLFANSLRWRRSIELLAISVCLLFSQVVHVGISPKDRVSRGEQRLLQRFRDDYCSVVLPKMYCLQLDNKLLLYASPTGCINIRGLLSCQKGDVLELRLTRFQVPCPIGAQTSELADGHSRANLCR